jgi:hypothetical protein
MVTRISKAEDTMREYGLFQSQVMILDLNS